MNKRTSIFIFLFILIGIGAKGQSSADFFKGERLYADVKHYVSLGEHRTATPADVATSAWLKKELDANGFQTRFVEFPLKQFFFEKGTLQSKSGSLAVFPLWHVNPQISQQTSGLLIDSKVEKDKQVYKNNIVVTRFPANGQTNEQTISILNPIIEAGAKAIIAITENKIGDLVAFNALNNLAPWKIPVVVAAPKDSTVLLKAVTAKETVQLSVKGTFKEVKARNVVGTFGNGEKVIVISTPISGWFTCGGERGPGIAIFLALARWINTQNLPYRFVFTANSGHELDNMGAHQFIEQTAPKPDQVHLWFHLGAGIATLAEQTEEADSTRNLMYSENVEASINQAFTGIAAKRWKVKDNALGELGVVEAHGYRRFAGIAHGHRFHHMPSDDASTTSPLILEEITLAIQKFLSAELSE